MSTIAAVIGRILIAIIFIASGATKLTTIAATDAQIVAVGLPSGLAIPTGLFEVILGLCLVFGIATRFAAILLAGFTFLTILFFHREFTDPLQLIMTLKNLAIIGGLLLVFAHSQMWWSWDRMRAERRNAIVARDAETRAHEADLRAARAEGALHAGAVPAGGRVVVADTDGDGVADTPVRRL